MATVALLVGGALVNALAFSGSNYFFSMLRRPGSDEERRRHDMAVEQLEAARSEWSRRRIARLDWANEDLRRQGHAAKTFREADAAFREYARVTGKNLNPLEPKPQMSDFYTPSSAQKDREIAFVALGMTAVGLVAYKIYRRESGK